jgi:glutamyl-tRNA synthetase
MIRVRSAPSPTGYLHIGSARTFIFNWLYASKQRGTMVLRIDDTDTDRNAEASLQSIYGGLRWLDLSWDEFYRQSERLDLLAKGFAYKDFTPASTDLEERPHGAGPWLCNPETETRALMEEQSAARAADREPFVIRFKVRREPAYEVTFHDEVYGDQSKLTADIEDFTCIGKERAIARLRKV